jgi:hypothetical protein
MRKLSFLATLLAILIVTALFMAATFADVSIGVKKGDWIEYQVVTTGNLENHDSQWASMEVTDVQGPVLSLNVTTLFNNGTYFYEPNIVLNLQTGHLGDDFFIPANLTTGDAFYDVRLGNITLTNSQQKTYVGAQRTVLTGTVVTTNGTETTTFKWDKQTGIMVQAFSNYTDYNFTMATVANGTNIWQPQTPVNATPIYALITAIVIVVVAVAAILVWRKKVQVKS